MGSTFDSAAPDAFRTFEVAGLAAEATTGMREDIVLLSWLIVLLRTKEDGQASFQWAYTGHDGQEVKNRSLSTEQVLPNLQSQVGDVSAVISKHISSEHVKPSTPASLLLSTGALSRTTEVGEEVSYGTCPRETTISLTVSLCRALSTSK